MAEDFNFAHLELEDFAKLYSFLALQSFDRCVYVSPSMIALNNCDDIFSIQTDTIALGSDKDKNASVFLFKPTADNFNTITTGLQDFDKNGKVLYMYLILLQLLSILVLQLLHKLNNQREIYKINFYKVASQFWYYRYILRWIFF